jgi:OOP family OmpA-OmpF porin
VTCTGTKVLLFITVLLVFFSANALADNRQGAVTLTPMAGYHVIDGGMDLDNEAAFGLGLGYNISEHWGIEGDVRYTSTQTDIQGVSERDVDILTLGLGALYHFQPEEELNPYLTLGGGGLIYDIDGSSSDAEDYMFYWGGGAKYALTETTALRLDLRHILDYLDDTGHSQHENGTWRHHFQAMFGVTFQFGGMSNVPVKETRAVEPAAMVAATADSDADGVLDSADKCPGTSPGVRVDASGCPADTDGDGVADFLDACIDTPQEAKVDARGCPDDADPVAEMALKVNFDINEDTVTSSHKGELVEAIDFINKFPGHKIEIEGHTDSTGDAIYNQNLSARRAENVRKALIETNAVAADRISARGFGEDKPLASNDTAAGRQQNRRVEVEILP